MQNLQSALLKNFYLMLLLAKQIISLFAYRGSCQLALFLTAGDYIHRKILIGFDPIDNGCLTPLMYFETIQTFDVYDIAVF